MWKQKGFTRTERDPVNNEIDVDWMKDMESDSFFYLDPVKSLQWSFSTKIVNSC